MPRHHLAGLTQVNLLGGTSKQEKAAFSPRFCFGSYLGGTISLHAFPVRLMTWRVGRLPRPHVLQEYTRAGAEVRSSGDGCTIVFDRGSLRRFYLCDVLLHEVGHHVDRTNLPKDVPSEERYATSFAARYLGLAVAALDESV